MKRGDLLESLADGATEGASSRVISVALFQPWGKTYNLTVDVGQTFYVGELKTWVHNTGPCGDDARLVGAEEAVKATVPVGKIGATAAASANARAALKAKLSGLQKAQKTAELNKALPDGRIRCYTQEVPARTVGTTRGAFLPLSLILNQATRGNGWKAITMLGQ